MKKWCKGFVFGIILTFVCIIAFNVYATGMKKTIEVYFNLANFKVNGKVVNADSINYKGINYVSVRAISEMLGKTVIWDSKTNTVHINDKNNNDILKSFETFIFDELKAEKDDYLVFQRDNGYWVKCYTKTGVDKDSIDIKNADSIVYQYIGTFKRLQISYYTYDYLTKSDAEKSFDYDPYLTISSEYVVKCGYKNNEWVLLDLE